MYQALECARNLLYSLLVFTAAVYKALKDNISCAEYHLHGMCTATKISAQAPQEHVHDDTWIWFVMHMLLADSSTWTMSDNTL